MKTKIAKKNVGGLLAALALLALIEGCTESPRTAQEQEEAEPQEVVDEDEETCRAGSCTSQPAQADESEEALPDEAAADGHVEEPRSEREDDEKPTRLDDAVHTGFDAGPDASADASVDGGPDASPEASSPDAYQDASPDAPDEPDAAVVSRSDAPDAAANASNVDAERPIDACTPNPCEHGGSCSFGMAGYACACPDSYVGRHCELEVCGSTTIRSPADLEQSRDCAEIRGDLNIASVGLTAIGADDFPLLTKITGDLVISGPQATDPPHLASVTLGKLRTVEGAVIVAGVSVIEFGASGPLQELHLPALERIGAHDAFGLFVYQAALKVLDLPALVAIDGSVMLDTLLELCTLRADSLERIGGEVQVHYLPQASPAQLDALRSAAAGQVRERLLGCCAMGADERVACESFTDKGRALHCGGCAPTPVAER